MENQLSLSISVTYAIYNSFLLLFKEDKSTSWVMGLVQTFLWWRGIHKDKLNQTLVRVCRRKWAEMSYVWIIHGQLSNYSHEADLLTQYVFCKELWTRWYISFFPTPYHEPYQIWSLLGEMFHYLNMGLHVDITTDHYTLFTEVTKIFSYWISPEVKKKLKRSSHCKDQISL